MTKFLEKYNKIISDYRDGAYGEENLSLYDILEKANETNIIDFMCLSELRQLEEKSTGFMKQYFLKNFLQRDKDIQKIAGLEDELHDFHLEDFFHNGEKIDENLAARLKLKIKYVDASELPPDVEALLLPSSDDHYNGEIKVLNESEIKFPYMHEIIHYFRDVGKGKPVQRVYTRRKKGKAKSKKEQQIDYLTAAAIMPYREVKKYLEEFEQISRDGEEKFFCKVANDYGQKKSTVERRIIEVRNLVDYYSGLNI